MVTNAGSHELFAHRLFIRALVRTTPESDFRVIDLTADEPPAQSVAERIELQRFIAFHGNLHAAGSA
jgi:hypothetical protein